MQVHVQLEQRPSEAYESSLGLLVAALLGQQALLVVVASSQALWLAQTQAMEGDMRQLGQMAGSELAMTGRNLAVPLLKIANRYSLSQQLGH